MSAEVTFVPLLSDTRYRDFRAGSLHSGPMEAVQSDRVRLIVASTDQRLRKLVCSTLSRDRRLEIVAQVGDGGAVLTYAEDFDVAVVDVSISGLGILGVMSGLSRRSARPVVVVVSRTDAIYLRHACLAEGASEYLVVPDDLAQLPDRVARAVTRAPTLVSSD